ncbi:MAG: Flp pilus assembly protein CpaB [Allosphingosinicella sp.]|uniref:Flp pilus assembly protein CpaB n=1 Tax=Allosphingosinicella sp. TaxID=2823234 RepID=UPI003924116E
MDVKKILLLIGALLVAGVTAVTAKNMFSGASAPQAQAGPVVPMGPEVLVATRSLPVGTIIDAEAIRFQPWPDSLIQSAYYLKGGEGGESGGVNPADLIGTVVRTEITAGQPVTQGALIRPGERGFLAAALGPGMRAITVPVNATSGVAGFVFPGDRVDIVMTHEVSGGGEGGSLKVSETILRNVRVLATDQRINSRDENGNQVVNTNSTVTLEATPRIAEKIAVAQTIGSLSLSLRSLADNSAELERAIAAGEIEVPENADPRAERRMLLAIANRPVDSNTTYTVGADVSRFQRATVPAKAASNNDNNNDPMRQMGAMIGALADRASGREPAPAAAAQPTGPVVRVARGNSVTVVPVGAK